MELMGHKSIEMTMRHAHLSPGHNLDAVQLLVRKPTGTTTGTEQTAEGSSKKLSRASLGKERRL